MFLRNRQSGSDITMSKLYDQDSFYKAFLSSIRACRNELVIESPFITARRMNALLPVFRKLSKRGVKILINTRNPVEHDEPYRQQAEEAVANLQDLGAKVLYTAGHHRKLAIIDRTVSWEGSLNILSHNDSCEIMREIRSPVIASELIQFIKVEPYLLRIGA